MVLSISPVGLSNRAFIRIRPIVMILRAIVGTTAPSQTYRKIGGAQRPAFTAIVSSSLADLSVRPEILQVPRG